jgi:2-desacetyl-2-hydroxyethyl bacteriochlorophyllide A dehydrogenase
MKAARLHRTNSRLRIDEIPIPRPRTKEVLVEIKAAGVCHSDINYRDGVAPVAHLPITLGHEFAGVIASKGKEVVGLKTGNRVAVHYIVSCGRCEYCVGGKENYCDKYRMIGKDVDGGFAKYAVVPASNVLRLPESLPLEEAAILGCAVSTAYHSLRRGRASQNDTVLVNGVGGLGLQAVQLAKRIVKAKEIIAIDISDEKLRLAMRFGATSVVNPISGDTEKTVDELTDGRLADVALDFVGSKNTVERTLRCIGKGGRLVVVGITSHSVSISPYSSIIGKEAEIIGVNDHLKSEMMQLIQHVESGDLNLVDSITHRFPLEDVNEAMDVLANQVGNPIRVVLQI